MWFTDAYAAQRPYQLKVQRPKKAIWIVCSIALLSWVAYLITHSLAPKASKPLSTQSDDKTQQIYLTNHGWHTSIVVDSTSVFSQLPELKQRFSGAKWFEFGWGDKGFYQAPTIKPVLAAKAILWPTPSVMHVVAIKQKPDREFVADALQPICLQKQHLESLLQFIGNSFERDVERNLIIDQPGIYGDSQFYLGTGHYTGLNTCNTWSAKALYSAGLSLRPEFKLTANSVTMAAKQSASPEHCSTSQ